MNKFLASLLITSNLIISACTAQSPEPQTTIETPDTTSVTTTATTTLEKDVIFHVPEGWTQDQFGFYRSPGDDPNNGSSILKSEFNNPENITLQEYLDKQFEECEENNPAPEGYNDILFVPCFHKLVSDLDEVIIDDYTVYRERIHGVPESGEEAERAYIVLNKKIVTLLGVYGVANVKTRNQHKKIIGEVLDTIKIK